MDRRDFIRGVATVAAAVGTAGAAKAAAEVADKGVKVKAEAWLTTDVVVCGGGPAGVCAAVSAARQGVKVLLVERFGCLGGNLTLGHVSPVLGKVSKGTMAQEVQTLLNAGHGNAERIETFNGPEEHVDHEEAKGILAKLCADAGVGILLGSSVVDALVVGSRVTGVVVDTPKGLRTIRARVVIDATGDGRVALAAGATVEMGRKGDGAIQPATIEFEVEGLDETRAITCWGETDPVKLSGGMEYRKLCEEKSKAGELPASVTIVRLHKTFYPGERSVNATQINGVDTRDPLEVGKAEVELRDQVNRCVTFLRRYVPGYENCRVKSSGGTLGVRETRRVTGDVVVSDEDVVEGRKYPDAVVHNVWFLVDIHNPKGGGQAEGYAHEAEPYDLRYGAFLPKGIDGLLTAGRCISGTHRAHASYRVMTPCMAMGEAVGIAAALSVKTNRLPRQVAATEVRAVLKARGVDLG